MCLNRGSCSVILLLAFGCQQVPQAVQDKPPARARDFESWFEIGGYSGEDSKGPVDDLGYCRLRGSETTHERQAVLLFQDESRTKGFSADDTGFRSGTVESLYKDAAWPTPVRIFSTS